MLSVAFTVEDAKGIIYPHDDPLVSLQISTAMVHHILLDGNSSANNLFMSTFEKIGLGRSCLMTVSYAVIRFTGESIVPEGTIRLPVKIGVGSQSRDLMVEFLVVDVPTTYNAIIGRPVIHDAQVVVDIYHLTMIYTLNKGKPDWLKGN